MSEEIRNEELQSEEIAAEEEKTQEASSKKEKLKEIKKENAALTAKCEELEAKLSQAEDKYLRIAAEYENFRKRTQKEKEAMYTDAYSDCILNVLPIVDNLERALEYADADSDKVVDGVKLTLKSLKESFEKMGVKEIETEIFDPNFHNAVAYEEREDAKEGEITQVFLKGYEKDGKVIRFAMVKVAN